MPVGHQLDNRVHVMVLVQTTASHSGITVGVASRVETVPRLLDLFIIECCRDSETILPLPDYLLQYTGRQWQ